MSEPKIESLLWKANLLARESTYFPRLVEVAAWHSGKEFTDHMLRKVASDTGILTALHVPLEEGVDAVLASYAAQKDLAEGMDLLIFAAVDAYQPPALEGEVD